MVLVDPKVFVNTIGWSIDRHACGVIAV